jgi:hypothetical protein
VLIGCGDGISGGLNAGKDAQGVAMKVLCGKHSSELADIANAFAAVRNGKMTVFKFLR